MSNRFLSLSRENIEVPAVAESDVIHSEPLPTADPPSPSSSGLGQAARWADNEDNDAPVFVPVRQRGPKSSFSSDQAERDRPYGRYRDRERDSEGQAHENGSSYKGRDENSGWIGTSKSSSKRKPPSSSYDKNRSQEFGTSKYSSGGPRSRGEFSSASGEGSEEGNGTSVVGGEQVNGKGNHHHHHHGGSHHGHQHHGGRDREYHGHHGNHGHHQQREGGEGGRGESGGYPLDSLTTLSHPSFSAEELAEIQEKYPLNALRYSKDSLFSFRSSSVSRPAPPELAVLDEIFVPSRLGPVAFDSEKLKIIQEKIANPEMPTYVRKPRNTSQGVQTGSIGGNYNSNASGGGSGGWNRGNNKEYSKDGGYNRSGRSSNQGRTIGSGKTTPDPFSGQERKEGLGRVKTLSGADLVIDSVDQQQQQQQQPETILARPPGISPPKVMWVYKGDHDQIQGPFTSEQMQVWFADRQLPPTLPVRRETDPDFVLLRDLGPSPFVPAPFPDLSVVSQQPIPSPTQPITFDMFGRRIIHPQMNVPYQAFIDPAMMGYSGAVGQGGPGAFFPPQLAHLHGLPFGAQVVPTPSGQIGLSPFHPLSFPAQPGASGFPSFIPPSQMISSQSPSPQPQVQAQLQPQVQPQILSDDLKQNSGPVSPSSVASPIEFSALNPAANFWFSNNNANQVQAPQASLGIASLNADQPSLPVETSVVPDQQPQPQQQQQNGPKGKGKKQQKNSPKTTKEDPKPKAKEAPVSAPVSTPASTPAPVVEKSTKTNWDTSKKAPLPVASLHEIQESEKKQQQQQQISSVAAQRPIPGPSSAASASAFSSTFSSFPALSSSSVPTPQPQVQPQPQKTVEPVSKPVSPAPVSKPASTPAPVPYVEYKKGPSFREIMASDMTETQKNEAIAKLKKPESKKGWTASSTASSASHAAFLEIQEEEARRQRELEEARLKKEKEKEKERASVGYSFSPSSSKSDSFSDEDSLFPSLSAAGKQPKKVHLTLQSKSPVGVTPAKVVAPSVSSPWSATPAPALVPVAAAAPASRSSNFLEIQRQQLIQDSLRAESSRSVAEPHTKKSMWGAVPYVKPVNPTEVAEELPALPKKAPITSKVSKAAWAETFGSDPKAKMPAPSAAAAQAPAKKVDEDDDDGEMFWSVASSAAKASSSGTPAAAKKPAEQSFTPAPSSKKKKAKKIKLSIN